MTWGRFLGVIFAGICCFCSGLSSPFPVESTCSSLEPSRYTVTPLHPFLYAGGAARKNRKAARGRNRGNCCIPYRHLIPVNTVLVVGKYPALFSKGTGSQPPLSLDEAHYLFCQTYGPFRIVGDSHLDKHISPSHDTEADFSIGFCHFRNHLERVFVDVDDIIEEVHRLPGNIF